MEITNDNEVMCHEGKLQRKSSCLAAQPVVGSKVAPPIPILAGSNTAVGEEIRFDADDDA